VPRARNASTARFGDPGFPSPGTLTLLFRLEAGTEEVEEYLEHGEGGHGEDHAEEPRYLSTRDDGEEDQDRGHVEGRPLYHRLQDVALELLDNQVEEGYRSAVVGETVRATMTAGMAPIQAPMYGMIAVSATQVPSSTA
jgi:hypothetical protein